MEDLHTVMGSECRCGGGGDRCQLVDEQVELFSGACGWGRIVEEGLCKKLILLFFLSPIGREMDMSSREPQLAGPAY